MTDCHSNPLVNPPVECLEAVSLPFAFPSIPRLKSNSLTAQASVKTHYRPIQKTFAPLRLCAIALKML
jgi:hypothetical protein